MKDKLSKVKNLVKKYGLTGTIKKMTGYIYSNYIVRISMKEKIYVALNKKEIRKRLKRMLEREDYDRIVTPAPQWTLTQRSRVRRSASRK